MSWRDLVAKVCLFVLVAFAVVGCATLLYLATGWPPGALMIISMMVVAALLIVGPLVSHKLGETYFYVLALFAVIGCAAIIFRFTGWPIFTVHILGLIACLFIFAIGVVLSDEAS